MKKLLILLFALAGNLMSQVYNFHYYNSGNGLTNTSITYLNQDNQGYIWIGTTSNIFRYDGYKFDEISLWNNELRTEIIGIAELKNQIWIATASKGIFVIKRNKEVVNLNNHLTYLPQKIKCIRKETDKLLFISQNNEFFLAQSDSQVSKILVDAILPQTNFNDIISIDNGYAIASDDGLIIFQYNRVKYKFNQSKSGKPIQAKALTLDKNRNIVFLSSNGSIYKVENYNLIELYSSNNNFSHFSVLVDRTNSIWAGFDDGILRIENKKENFIGFANGLPHQVVTALFEDREGNIWIGTLNGIAKLNSLAIKNYPSLFPKVTSSIYKIFRSGKEVSVFTDEGVSIFNFNNGTIQNFNFNFSSRNNVNDVVEFNSNSKLVATNNGLYIWQGNRLIPSNLNSQINSKRILSLAKDSNNRIYVGTDSGLFVFQGNKLIDYLSVDDVLPSNQINAILVTKYDEVWIGTESGLVKKVDDNVLVLRTGNGLINNFITSLSEDTDGRIWIGTKKGLSSFKNGRFNNFNLRINGYTIDEINDVLPIKENEIWIATPRGIFKIKNGVEYSFLTSKDGLLSDYITDLEYEPQNEIIFVGTNSGLTTIELKYLKENKFSYKIFFTGFYTQKRSYDLNNPIKISEDEEEIKINVSIFSFFDEKKIIYRYRIKEIEDSWNYLSGSNEIQYKNLNSGKYTLIVQASVDGINWLNNSAELKFEIHSGLFKNFLFYGSILIGLLFIYASFVFVRNSIRSKKLISKAEEKLTEIEQTSQTPIETDIIQNQQTPIEEIEEIKKRFEDKIESMKNIVLEKDKIIETLKNENLILKEKIFELENLLNSKQDIVEDDTEFVEKSRIEIIVKNSQEAEEIKRYIEALEKTNWSIRAAAKLLNIPHSTLHYRLKKLKLLKNK